MRCCNQKQLKQQNLCLRESHARCMCGGLGGAGAPECRWAVRAGCIDAVAAHAPGASNSQCAQCSIGRAPGNPRGREARRPKTRQAYRCFHRAYEYACCARIRTTRTVSYLASMIRPWIRQRSGEYGTVLDLAVANMLTSTFAKFPADKRILTSPPEFPPDFLAI